MVSSISDKERSGYMKPYVEKIETEAMYAEKSWGTYTVIDVQPGSMTVKAVHETWGAYDLSYA